MHSRQMVQTPPGRGLPSLAEVAHHSSCRPLSESSSVALVGLGELSSMLLNEMSAQSAIQVKLVTGRAVMVWIEASLITNLLMLEQEHGAHLAKIELSNVDIERLRLVDESSSVSRLFQDDFL